MNKKLKQMFKAAKNLRESTTKEAYERMKVLEANYYAFSQNYREVNSLFEDVEKDESLWDQKYLFKQEVLRLELLRKVRNFISEAKMLVDSIDSYSRKMNLRPCIEIYAQEKKELERNSLNAFITDLHKFMQSRVLPISNDKRRIYLDLKTLKKWKEWTKKSIKYLNHKQLVETRVILVDYFNLVNEFYAEFESIIHENDLKQYNVFSALEEQERVLEKKKIAQKPWK